MSEIEKYHDDIKSFEKILSSQADKLLSDPKDITVVYIGKEVCPFCRKFVDKLSRVSDEVNTTIYYVDSMNSSDTNLESFRDKFDIPTVPGFIVQKNNETEVICDSSLPEETILDMLKLNN